MLVQLDFWILGSPHPKRVQYFGCICDMSLKNFLKGTKVSLTWQKTIFFMNNQKWQKKSILKICKSFEKVTFKHFGKNSLVGASVWTFCCDVVCHFYVFSLKLFFSEELSLSILCFLSKTLILSALSQNAKDFLCTKNVPRLKGGGSYYSVSVLHADIMKINIFACKKLCLWGFQQPSIWSIFLEGHIFKIKFNYSFLFQFSICLCFVC